MKVSYYILTTLFVLTSFQGVQAQKGQQKFFRAPDRVVDVLDSLYPGAKEVQWSKKRNRYTADFIYDSRNFSISMNYHGKILTRVEEIKYELLPDRVKEKLEQFYNTYKIVMVSQRSANTKVDYDIEIIQGRQHYMLNYNNKGYLIRQYNLLKLDRFAEASED